LLAEKKTWDWEIPRKLTSRVLLYETN